MATPHHSLVERVFSVREDVFGELRTLLPPEIVAALELHRLALQEGWWVDPALVQRHVDLLYSVPLKSGAGSALVYVLFEHQSSDDPLMVFRMLAYMVRVWEKYLRDHEGARELPVIVPLVLHHAEEGWRSATTLHELFPASLLRQPAWAGVVPSFRFLLDDVSVTTDEELGARQLSEFARVALWALRDARFGRLERTLAAWSSLFARLLEAPGGQTAVRTIFCYIYEVRGIATAQSLAAKIPDPILREAAMTIAEQLRQEGRQDGLREGLERLRGVVVKQLQLKFGELPAAAQARVAAADAAALERYAERVLSADTLDAVIG